MLEPENNLMLAIMTALLIVGVGATLAGFWIGVSP
jgi:hypothetical protein